MFSIATIQSALYSWVTTQITTIPVIWLNPNAPRPATAYMSLNIKMMDTNGTDWLTPPDDAGLASLFGNREFAVELNYYGGTAAQGLGGIDILEKLQTSLGQFDVQNTLLEAGVIFVDRLTMLNVAELLDTRWQERFILELRFRTSNQGITNPSQFNIGFIERTSVSGELVNEVDESTDIDIEVDID